MAGTHIPGEVNGETLALQHLPRELLGEILHHLSLKSLLRFQCVNKNFCVAVDTLFSPFPLKVIHEILLRLPVKSLLRFKCVNKRWSDLINSPFFVSSHLQRSLDYYNDTTKTALAFMNDTGIYLIDDLNHPGSQPTRLNWLQPYDLDYTSMRLVGSCNGLLCFKTCPSHDRSFYVCNPSMRTFKEVVDPDPLLPPSDYVAGFGHDMENDDYKVVMVHIYGEDTFIYSLKADSWRRPTQKQHPKDCFDRFSDFTYYKSVFLNNRLHWVSRKDGCGGIQICAFDLCSEQWSTLQLPIDPCRAVRFNGAIQTGLSHGCLCLCLQGSSTVRVSPRSYITHSTTVDIWIMKEYGVQGSWHKLASVDDSLHHLLSTRPAFITYSEEGCKFLFSSDDCSFANLVWYDSEQKTYTRFGLPGIEQFGADFVLCAESIVSITSSCKEE